MSSSLAETLRDDDVLLTLPRKVDPGHTAVLVIDVRNDFRAPGGYYVHRAALASVEANFGVVATADALASSWRLRSQARGGGA